MKDNNFAPLGERLLAVSEYVRCGAVLCDVGTDHAKLPIYLASTGKIKKAYATDINEGPIKCARANVAELDLGDIIECIRTDGLYNTDSLEITDISICGMGGELIARILSDCPYIKNSDVNLILQPMSHTEDLRRYLYDAGFDIKDECLVRETGKLYLIINASYTGEKYEYEDIDLILGKILKSKKRDDLFFEMAERALYHLENRLKSNDAETVEVARELYKKVKEALL